MQQKVLTLLAAFLLVLWGSLGAWAIAVGVAHATPIEAAVTVGLVAVAISVGVVRGLVEYFRRERSANGQ